MNFFFYSAVKARWVGQSLVASLELDYRWSIFWNMVICYTPYFFLCLALYKRMVCFIHFVLSGHVWLPLKTNVVFQQLILNLVIVVCFLFKGNISEKLDVDFNEWVQLVSKISILLLQVTLRLTLLFWTNCISDIAKCFSKIYAFLCNYDSTLEFACSCRSKQLEKKWE